MFAFVKFIFRMVGHVLLACALVALVADGSRSIARSEISFQPLGQFWFNLSPETLNLAQAAIQRHVSPFLWDPVVQTLLTWPIWAVVFPLGLLLLWLGARRRRERPAFV